MPAMKSPFPGMDPYLEPRWSDVHPTLLTLAKEALQPALPPGLRARSEERVLLENVEGELRGYRSDVAVVSIPPDRRPVPGSPGAGGTATIEPVLVDLPSRPPFERFVQIVDVSSGHRVVTVIEVLSPWNKRGGRLNEDYRRKIEDYADAEVNVVEIDLLRSSRSRLGIGQEDLPIQRRTPYLVCVRRASRLNRWEVYPLPLREPLPRVPVPLRAKTDADVPLDLQPLIERAYIAGGHDDIDYAVDADPPLEGDDARWADELLKSAGRR